MTLEKTYQPLALEKKWYHHWEKSNYFSPELSQEAYCIMLPPPNVTGTLHMGHAFQDTLMDTLIRYHRMKGHQTLWQGGTDHAGIATQMVVERQLHALDMNKHDLGREAFIQKVWEWKSHSGNTICQQMRRLGASLDWSRERFTMDDGLSEAVKEVFVRLYEEGLIYRGKRLVNWDPKLHTAVSDLEVISHEEQGNLWYIRYPVENKNMNLVVATTRPETMLGDVAVAVHPEDARYKHLIGEKVRLPLCDRLIPIIADEYVDPEFGTGCVKITPAHDFNDYEVGKRHHLEMINIFTEDAILNNNAPKPYQNMDRVLARHVIVTDLAEKDLLEKIEPHTLKVPRGDRSGEIVEPLLTDQWFVNVKPLAIEAVKAVESGKIKFVPENWTKIYFDWMNNIQDWCISRQIWWGHRIPAWYDADGKIYVGRNEKEVREKYKLGEIDLCQDHDVLDTWFSSALWPFSTLGWPHQTPELSKYYPTNVLVTGFDIIFFWVARMIMMGLKFMGDVPFQQVFVTGLIQDAHGHKMSKSKGNIIDPIDLIDGIDLESLVQKRTSSLMQPAMARQIEEDTRKDYPHGIPSFGTDALRFTLCAIASTGRHIRFEMARVEGYRNFCNKIWNASRFVFMNLEDKDLGKTEKDREYSVFDLGMLSLWQKTKKNIEEHIATYRFDLVAHAIYEFIWNHYCDWYLELTKPILNQPEFTDIQRAGTRFMLGLILEEILRVTHPIMPFITEEIWQMLKPILGEQYFSKNTESIMLQSYPEPDLSKINEKAEQSLKWVQTFILAVRNIRGEMNIAPSKRLTAHYRTKIESMHHVIHENSVIIKNLAKLDNIQKLNQDEKIENAASFITNELEVYLPLEGLIDVGAEKERLTKDLAKYQKDIDFYEKKFANQGYLNKAPKDVIEKERAQLAKAIEAAEKLLNNLNNIKDL